MVEGHQLTIEWPVDDNKNEPHVLPGVDQLLGQLNEVFGKEAPLMVNKTGKHDYLGITLDYSHAGKVIINMQQYIQGVLDKAPSDMQGMANTLTSAHLFQ